jgi:hypothetical protein
MRSLYVKLDVRERRRLEARRTVVVKVSPPAQPQDPVPRLWWGRVPRALIMHDAAHIAPHWFAHFYDTSLFCLLQLPPTRAQT